MPDVSVIIPARDAAATLQATLDGLAAQTFSGEREVVLVDDGSSDATAEIAARSPVVSRVVRGSGDGPSAARNAGAEATSARLLAFIDADCRPARQWLQAGVEALATADYVQGMTHPDPNEHVGPFDRSLWVTRPSPLYESANLFISRELFDRLGGFEPWLLPRNGKELGEDVWLGWRARRAGARMAFCPDALAEHAVFKRSIADYVAERARLRYFPAMAKRIPELRAEFYWARYFHSRRSAAFDAALLGLSAAAFKRRPEALAAALPYAWLLYSSGRGGSARHLVKVSLAGVAADAVGAAALVTGSIRYRAPVL